MHLFAKALFNILAEVKMPFDLWTMMDLVSAFMNIVAFNVIGKATPEMIINYQTKSGLDYYVIAILVFSWLRFFAYFLIVEGISVMIMTLLRMLIDAMAFVFIFICYLLIVTTIFTTVFQTVDPDEYGSLSLSFLTLYTAFIGPYTYEAADNGFSISGSIFVVTHRFLSSIFLMNFLIAILSSVFEYMKDDGKFEFKKAKYEFIEKYSIALMDPNGYYEIVIHPPPINFFSLFLLPFLIKGSIMKIGSRFFAKFMFWFENCLFILYYTGYLFALCPLIILKVLTNIWRLASVWTKVPLTL